MSRHRHETKKTRHFRNRHDRPEKHTIAELVQLDHGFHGTGRFAGVLATLDRIERIAIVAEA